MLNSKATQFTLSPAGEILWQEKVNNPLPGVPVAQLIKGDHPLRPQIKPLEAAPCAGHSETDLMNCFNIWLNGHLQTVLEPLMLLGIAGGDAPSEDDLVGGIAHAVYDGLGIVARESLEDVIAKLDAEKRAELRTKKIRLGPVLVFIPALNKPAAVRLRGLLWSLFHDAPLPASLPADGIVSVAIAPEANPDPAFYRAIGYPLYGGRAVRIDMLDRVINAIYDNAKEGKFQARHEMAEWLGCSIENLYKVLSDMGHTKVFDPAEQPQEEVSQDAVVEPAATEAVPPQEEGTETKPAAEKQPQEKPALATFRLKRGKAFEKPQSGGKKPFTNNRPKQDGAKPHDKSKRDEQKGGFKDKKHKDKKHGGKKKFDDSPRVISIEAKQRQEDSPFAILQQLKKSDG